MDFSIPAAGMQAESTAFDAAASGIARSSLPPSDNRTGSGQSAPDNLDLTTSAIALLQAKFGFEADVKTAEVENEMTKSTLSIVG
jgi:flagellar basal body rod protein FlgC